MHFDPELYNLVHMGNPGDLPFYINVLRNTPSVLELGCGSGRIATALAQQGCRVTAVDRHPGMLAILADRARAQAFGIEKNLTTLCADMREFKLQKAFPAVIIPYNALLCLLTEEAVLDCLKQVALHLTSTGQLIFDIYHVPEALVDDDEDKFDQMATVYDRGRKIEIFERAVSHQDPRRLDTVYRHLIRKTNGTRREVEYVIEQRAIYPEEIESLLKRANLKLISITGDFTESAITLDTSQLVIRAAPMR